MSPAALKVIDPGPHTVVEDLGRPGNASWGIGRSGAADRRSLRLANRMVGNDENAAGLEVQWGGLELRPDRDVVVALTGARCPVTIGSRNGSHNSVLRVPADAVLRLGRPVSGVRTYVGVRGGIDVPPVLGSRSHDVLSGLGPAVLSAGTVLPVGPPPARFPCVDVAPVPDPPAGAIRLRVLLGPHEDWFTPRAIERFLQTTWAVTPESNRVGMRLSGVELTRKSKGELVSTGVVRGSLQVTVAAQPIMFMSDHPLTGGYPVIAVVLEADVDRAAQACPGQQLRFQLARDVRVAS